MNQFFVSENDIRDGVVKIKGGDLNHIKNVLRMTPGEIARLSTGEQVYEAKLEEVTPSEAVFRIHSRLENTELPSEITLFQGIPKNDKMELITQKAVEIGAARIVPVEMERSVSKWDEKKKEKQKRRLSEISKSAAEQSKRAVIPEVTEAVSFSESLKMASALSVTIVPYEDENDIEASHRIVEGLKPGESIGVFIGPEGGFSENEIRKIKENGGIPVSLGRRILRTETAGLFMLSVLSFHLERK